MELKIVTNPIWVMFFIVLNGQSHHYLFLRYHLMYFNKCFSFVFILKILDSQCWKKTFRPILYTNREARLQHSEQEVIRLFLEARQPRTL